MAAVLAWLGEHYELVALVATAIESGKVSKAQMMQIIEEAMKAASDAEMAREFPNG